MKINLKLVKSSLDSIREDYTALVIANGKTSQEDLIAAVNKAEPHISKISAEQVLATQLAFIGAMLAEGNYVNMGGIGLSPYVEGSLLHADEEVTSDMLGIQVNVYDSEYLEAIKSLEVTTTVDEDSLPFNFTKVEDSATHDFGTVTPGAEFMPIGDKLSQGLDGERIEITDKVGTTKVITNATGSSNGMWLKATCPFGLVAGKGKIAVYSRGLKTPEGDVDHITRNIAIREASIEPGPRIKQVVMEGHEATPDVMPLNWSAPLTIFGSKLALQPGDKLSVELWKNGACVESGDLTENVTSSEDDKIELSSLSFDGQEQPDGDWWNADTRLIMTRNGIRSEHSVTFTE